MTGKNSDTGNMGWTYNRGRLLVLSNSSVSSIKIIEFYKYHGGKKSESEFWSSDTNRRINEKCRLVDGCD